MKRALALGVVALALAGCSDDETAVTTTDTVTLPAFVDAKVYWLRDGKVWPVSRELAASGTEALALDELVAGPSGQEKARLDATTAVPDRTEIDDLAIDQGVASMTLSAESLPRAALAQIVYTLTQFSTVKSVEIEGRRYGRADFENQTPAILVESPLPFADVSGPLTVTGTANTFEATFEYELLDANGTVVDENFVTATSGTGMRGTFDFTTKDASAASLLRVYESSAKDGSRINVREIPLRAAR